MRLPAQAPLLVFMTAIAAAAHAESPALAQTENAPAVQAAGAGGKQDEAPHLAMPQPKATPPNAGRATGGAPKAEETRVRASHRVDVIAPGERIESIILTMRLDWVFDTFDTVEEALGVSGRTGHAHENVVSREDPRDAQDHLAPRRGTPHL